MVIYLKSEVFLSGWLREVVDLLLEIYIHFYLIKIENTVQLMFHKLNFIWISQKDCDHGLIFTHH